MRRQRVNGYVYEKAQKAHKCHLSLLLCNLCICSCMPKSLCRTEFGKLFTPSCGKHLVSVEEKENMGWDSEFFMPKNSFLVGEKEADKEKRFVRCAECNELIGAVSVALYEIDEKRYCSGCYSRKIVALAVERDHSDLKQEKTRYRSQE